METNIHIMIVPGQPMLIGKLVDTVAGSLTLPITLEDPRVLAPQNNAVVFSALLGNPKRVTISVGGAAFKVEDEELINTYIRAVTGIALARPSNVFDIKGGKVK